ncbi:MAG TPA: choline-sulfatase, partial [Acidobacteriota bacterium]
AFPARRVAKAVSLVDVLPSLVELASDGAGGAYATPLEGRSLVPHLSDSGGHDEAVGEYFGEGTAFPLFMIRRGRFKYVAAQGDPPQLYNLAEDPRELTNLAASERRRDAVALFAEEAERRWDVAALKEAVLESQRQRLFVAPVLRAQGTSWDYQPPGTAAESYIRNTMPIGELERRARFPAV